MLHRVRMVKLLIKCVVEDGIWASINGTLPCWCGAASLKFVIAVSLLAQNGLALSRCLIPIELPLHAGPPFQARERKNTRLQRQFSPTWFPRNPLFRSL